MSETVSPLGSKFTVEHLKLLNKAASKLGMYAQIRKKDKYTAVELENISFINCIRADYDIYCYVRADYSGIVFANQYLRVIRELLDGDFEHPAAAPFIAAALDELEAHAIRYRNPPRI